MLRQDANSHLQGFPALYSWQQDPKDSKVTNRSRGLASKTFLEFLDLGCLLLPQESRRLGQRPRQAILVKFTDGRSIQLSLHFEGSFMRKECTGEQTREFGSIDRKLVTRRFQVDFERLTDPVGEREQ